MRSSLTPASTMRATVTLSLGNSCYCVAAASATNAFATTSTLRPPQQSTSLLPVLLLPCCVFVPGPVLCIMH